MDLLCQPDCERGCSACCGIFNLRDISRENIARVLQGTVSFPNDYDQLAVRDLTSHICPYQGFVKDSVPGCSIHPLLHSVDHRDQSIFGKKICDNFICPAHYLLSGDEKEFLLQHVRDWYVYMIAIIDPESFQWIYEQSKNLPVPDSSYMSDIVTNALKIHAEGLQSTDCPVFHYSIPEYELGKDSFSLYGTSCLAQETRQCITEMLAACSYS